MLSCKGFTGFTGTCLEKKRCALRTGVDYVRAGDVEVFALVVNLANELGVGVYSALAV
jgi:hypothetical protein